MYNHFWACALCMKLAVNDSTIDKITTTTTTTTITFRYIQFFVLINFFCVVVTRKLLNELLLIRNYNNHSLRFTVFYSLNFDWLVLALGMSPIFYVCLNLTNLGVSMLCDFRKRPFVAILN